MKKYTYHFADRTTSTVEVSDELYEVMLEYDDADRRAWNRQKYKLDVELSVGIASESEGEADYPPSVYAKLAEWSDKLREDIVFTEKEKECVNAYLRTGSLRKAARETEYSYVTIKNMLDCVVRKLQL